MIVPSSEMYQPKPRPDLARRLARPVDDADVAGEAEGDDAR
jgi:hypothetical protein